MGGDGGTISSNRTFLRGAGKSTHTADHPSNALRRAKLEESEKARLVLTACAISGTVLDLSPAKGGGGGTTSRADIVTCPFGKLYKREKVLEALLQRSQNQNTRESLLGSQIRGMKDLHPVRFHVAEKQSSQQQRGSNGNNKRHYMSVCPITVSELGSGNVPCFVIVRTKTKEKSNKEEDDEISRNPNVLSERAIKEMGIAGLQSEYGPFEERDMIRLAPPTAGGVFEEIQRRWEERVEEERLAKLQKKKDKKRKRNEENPKNSNSLVSSAAERKPRPVNNEINSATIVKQRGVSTKKKSAVDEARSSVQSAMAQNPVLSNLFAVGKSKKSLSENEKRNALFTRNC